MKSIKRNFAYNLLLNMSMVLFPLVTAPYIARVLEPDNIGMLNFADSYAGYYTLFAFLGIPTYGVREVAKVKDDPIKLRNLVSQLMSMSFYSSAIVSILYIISICTVSQLRENILVFLLCGVPLFLTPFNIQWYYQGTENFGFITFRTLVMRIVSIICLFIFVHDRDDVIIYVALQVLGCVAGYIWNFQKMFCSGLHPFLTRKGVLAHFKPVMILFLSTIAISIYTILDTLMLGFLREYSEVAYYSNSMHITKAILVAVSSLSIVAVPRISYYAKIRDYSNIQVLFNKSFSFVSFLAFPIAFVMLCIAPTFVPLFYGPKFVGVIAPLMILSLLFISLGLNNLTGMQILFSMGFDRLFLYSVSSGMIVNFILNLLMIPLWGAIGASVSSVIAETFILAVTTYFVYTKTPIRITAGKDLMRCFIGSMLLFPLFLLLKTVLNGWLLVFVFIILGALLYLAIEKKIKNHSLELFISILKPYVDKIKTVD